MPLVLALIQRATARANPRAQEAASLAWTLF